MSGGRVARGRAIDNDFLNGVFEVVAGIVESHPPLGQECCLCVPTPMNSLPPQPPPWHRGDVDKDLLTAQEVSEMTGLSVHTL